MRLTTLTTLAISALATLTVKVNGTQPVENNSNAGPNIVLILADDLGYGDVGFNGQPDVATPHLDRIASQGLVFNRFYAGSTVCAPARATLLTGNHTGRVWQRFNGTIQFREDPLDLTIASRLQQAGYRTAMIGKSGLACNSQDAGLPNRKGFEHFFGFLAHVDAHRQYPRTLVRNGDQVHYPQNQGKEGEVLANDVFVDEACQWLERQRAGQPFFLHLAFTQPHADLAAPKEFVRPYVGRFPETPFPEGQHYRATPHPTATYAGMVTHLDHCVGRVIERLQELGLAENTLVLFTSDNGPHGEGGKDPLALNSSGSLRGYKRDLYEGGLRVPTVAWWPGTIGPQQRTDHVSAFWDFPPTALELAGAAIPQDMDGLSLVPTLLGRGQQPQHEYLYWEFHEQGGKQAVLQGRWKGIRLNVQRPQQTRFELYDLEADPREENDLAQTHPEIVARLQAFMEAAHRPTPRVTLRQGVLLDN